MKRWMLPMLAAVVLIAAVMTVLTRPQTEPVNSGEPEQTFAAPPASVTPGPDLSMPQMYLTAVVPAQPLDGTQPFVVRGSLGDKRVLEDEEGVYTQSTGFEKEFDFRLTEDCDVRVPADFYGDPEAVPCSDLMAWAQAYRQESGWDASFWADVSFDENGYVTKLHYHYYHDQ